MTEDEHTQLAVVIERLDQQDRRFGSALDRIERRQEKTNGSLSAAVDRLGVVERRQDVHEETIKTLARAGRSALEFRKALKIGVITAVVGPGLTLLAAYLAHVHF